MEKRPPAIVGVLIDDAKTKHTVFNCKTGPSGERSYLIKAALPLLFSPLQISTLRVTQGNEIMSRNGMFTCAYFGNNISFFKYLSLMLVHFPQQALSVLSCFPSIHPLQHVSFTVMFSSSKNLSLLCSQVVFMQRTRLWSKKGDKVNEGSWGEKIQKTEWRQSALIKTTCSSEKHGICGEIKQEKAKRCSVPVVMRWAGKHSPLSKVLLWIKTPPSSLC